MMREVFNTGITIIADTDDAIRCGDVFRGKLHYLGEYDDMPLYQLYDGDDMFVIKISTIEPDSDLCYGAHIVQCVGVPTKDCHVTLFALNPHGTSVVSLFDMDYPLEEGTGYRFKEHVFFKGELVPGKTEALLIATGVHAPQCRITLSFEFDDEGRCKVHEEEVDAGQAWLDMKMGRL